MISGTFIHDGNKASRGKVLLNDILKTLVNRQSKRENGKHDFCVLVVHNPAKPR